MRSLPLLDRPIEASHFNVIAPFRIVPTIQSTENSEQV
jgi:hypothetical protein